MICLNDVSGNLSNVNRASNERRFFEKKLNQQMNESGVHFLAFYNTRKIRSR